MAYLSKCGVLLKDFRQFSENETKTIVSNIENYAKENHVPLQYINNGETSKEAIARKYLEEMTDSRTDICILSCLETCHSARVYGSDEGLLKLRDYHSVCKHYYIYRMDPQLGFMWIKIQTWFPYNMQVYINGRELMRHTFDAHGITYSMYDNSFSTLSNISLAQEFADKFDSAQLSTSLDAIARRFNPQCEKIHSATGYSVYWTINQCEYATDIMFKEASFLEDIYPSLVEHAFFDFTCDDIFTFLGRKLVPQFQGEAVSDYKKRRVGIRVKYRVKTNSVKMYNKCNCLRIETTLNNLREFKIYDDVHHKDGTVSKGWKPMSKSISVMYRIAEISKSCNNRFISAVQNVVPVKSSERLIEDLCSHVTWNGKRYTGINPWDKETFSLLTEIMNGKYLLKGFRNSDLSNILYGTTKPDRKKVSKTSRMLRKLRAHKLIRKILHSHRYMVSDTGHKVLGALISAREKTFPAVAAVH